MASVTITTTAPQDARLAPAIGAKLSLGGNANAAQVKQWLIDQLRAAVIDYERQQGIAGLTPPSTFDPT